MDINNLYTEKENFLVVLDSRNATSYYNGDFHSSLHFDFNEPIKMPKFAIRMCCSVLQFQAPNSLYNINEKIIGQRGLVLASVSLIFGLFKQH